MIPVSISKAKDIIVKCFKANIQSKKLGKGIYLVPYLHSAPSQAKSASMDAIAKQFNLKFIPISLSMEEPIMIIGGIKVENGRTINAPPTRIPLATDPLPLKDEYIGMTNQYEQVLAKGGKELKVFQKNYCYSGFLVFFDEFADAPPTLQRMCNRILNERMVGTYHIHPLCMLAGAGNRIQDKAGVTSPMSSATKSRLWHISVTQNYQDTLDYFIKEKFDMRIIATLVHYPEELDSFEEYLKSKSADYTYRCSRTWEMVNCFLRANYPNTDEALPDDAAIELEGAIGSFASRMVVLSKVVDELPKLEDIVSKPETTPIPDSNGACMMLISSLATKMNKDNQSAIIKYVLRMNSIFIQPFVYTAFNNGIPVIEIEELGPYIHYISKLAKKLN